MTQSNPVNEILAAKRREMEADLDRQIAELLEAVEELRRMKKVIAVRAPAPEQVASPEAESPAPAADEAPARPVNTGFRNLVKGVVRDHPKGIKPGELIKLLESRSDLVYNGKLTLANRVYSELYALKNKRTLSERNGRYTFNAEHTNGQT
jgi:hypothetical protein